MKRKLIEVALPLEAINKESAREKSIRHGHPSTLHLWWARRPLAACRAVLWSSLVDDPSSHPDRFPTDEDQERERMRLFAILEELVKWENSNNETVLAAARAEIMASTDGNPPPVLDPFCGGGSIPLEAQRLGLEAHASDLNPVAVLITKALIEIPPKFAGRPPVHPSEGSLDVKTWKGAQGLAEDVRYYGNWMRDRAVERIGHLYPKVELPEGGEATVIAWLWARTVKCPNPACGATMPLVRSFALSTKKGKETWVEPIVDLEAKTVRFEIRKGAGRVPDPPKIGRGAKFRCLVCDQTAPDDHIKSEGRAGRMGVQLMAIVAEGDRRREYVAPDEEHVKIAESAEPAWSPDEQLVHDPRAIWVVPYGLTKHRDLFTPRQLVALTTFSDLVGEAREQVLNDAVAAGLPGDGIRLADGGTAAPSYADALATYLAFALSKLLDRSSSLVTWFAERDSLYHTFSRQALPMTWDFAESNTLQLGTGTYWNAAQWTADVVDALDSVGLATAVQNDATTIGSGSSAMVSTDPPYYDNIGYADLSDFFYVWLRRSLDEVHPSLFSTLLTPKTEELVATPYRFGGSKAKAEKHFEDGLGDAFERIREGHNAAYPMTTFYAFKQAEQTEAGIASTGWDTMLQGLITSGFSVVGTWPMRSELSNRTIARGSNALASSIVLVCRPRPDDAPPTTRKEFLAALRSELPEALRTLQHGNIAPVDLQQAAIGPGMAVFSRHSKVVEADGSAMTVRAALGLINQSLDEILAEQEGDFDPETRWAVTWFEQHGTAEGPYGVAEVLATAKNTSVSGMVDAGILSSKAGKVRILTRDELDLDWDPGRDLRLTVWEVTQHLISLLETGGEVAAAGLLRRVGGLAEPARELAYRLYVICDRKHWAQEALSYNALVVAWPDLIARGGGPEQQTLGG